MPKFQIIRYNRKCLVGSFRIFSGQGYLKNNGGFTGSVNKLDGVGPVDNRPSTD